MTGINYKHYTAGLLLSFWAQQLLTFTGLGLLYELYLRLVPQAVAGNNPYLGWELSWMMPIEITLFLAIFWPVFWMPILLNALMMWGFLVLDRAVNAQRESMVVSFGVAALVLVLAWVLTVVLWLIVQAAFIGEQASRLSEMLSPTTFPEGNYSLLIGNALFFCLFVPLWHFQMRRWRYGGVGQQAV